jgi:hypothetical protein
MLEPDLAGGRNGVPSGAGVGAFVPRATGDSVARGVRVGAIVTAGPGVTGTANGVATVAARWLGVADGADDRFGEAAAA